MVESYSSKSSITADTAFRKDLTLQGCPNVPTRTINPTEQRKDITTRTLLHYNKVQEAT